MDDKRRSEKCIKENRNKFQPRTVRETKFKPTNYQMRDYMKTITNDIEKRAKIEAKKNAIKLNDLSITLRPDLYKRISNIIPLQPIEDDFFEEENEKEIIINNTFAKKIEFNESTCSLIEALEMRFNDFEVNIGAKVDRKARLKKYPKNWQSEYICKKRKDRITWNTKLYTLETELGAKKLDEQAEILMNSASQRFTEWINNITTNTETNISKEYLMSLFQINSGAKILGNIQIEPKIMGAVPRKVAATWRMPECSIEIKLANKIKEIMKKVPKKLNKIAFGRTIPYNELPWIPTDAYNIIKPVFPTELRTCKNIFEGITHLYSIRNFVQYCKEDWSVKRPEYLVEMGCFKSNDISESDGPDIPLYELLDCKF